MGWYGMMRPTAVVNALCIDLFERVAVALVKYTCPLLTCAKKYLSQEMPQPAYGTKIEAKDQHGATISPRRVRQSRSLAHIPLSGPSSLGVLHVE